MIQWPTWGLADFRLVEGLGLVEKGRYLWQASACSKKLVVMSLLVSVACITCLPLFAARGSESDVSVAKTTRLQPLRLPLQEMHQEGEEVIHSRSGSECFHSVETKCVL